VKFFKFLKDIDQDGFIDYKEFIMGVKMLERKNKKEDLSHLQFAFSVFDLNADNLISFEEFEIILQSANPEMNTKKISEMVDKYFEGVDKKGMSFEKFKSLCVKNPEIVKMASGVLFGLLKQTLKK
jgi:Ca2+-binding EF-hand superfamily protein